MSQKLSEADIFKAYRAAEQLKKAEMARVLEIPRQRYGDYESDSYKPTTSQLTNWFLYAPEPFVREMALEMLVRRPVDERPCVCLEVIGDNGPCPRHSAELVEEMIEKAGKA